MINFKLFSIHVRFVAKEECWITRREVMTDVTKRKQNLSHKHNWFLSSRFFGFVRIVISDGTFKTSHKRA